jgi:hypothetical protein
MYGRLPGERPYLRPYPCTFVYIRGKIKHQAALDCGALASDHTRSVRRPTLHPPSVNIRVHSWTKEKAVEPCVLHTQRPASQQLAQPLTTHYSLLTTATKSPLPLSLLPTASAISLKLAKRLTRSALQASARTGPAAAGPTIREHPCSSVDFLL